MRAWGLITLTALEAAPSVPACATATVQNQWSLMPSVPAQSREHPINVVSVESQGSLLWNGLPVSQAQVREYLAIVRQMTSNVTVLKLEADAPDKIVAEIKELMTHGLACTPVTCVEVRAAASKPAP